MLAGYQVAVAHGRATAHPTFDVETYSEAGYRWDAGLQKWQSPEGIANTKRGLPVCGTYNYVQHHTFELLCLCYNLLDGFGWRFWKAGQPRPEPLIEHIAAGRPIAGWNSGGFEFVVWNEHCVPKLGWGVPIRIEQLHDDMAKATVFGLPRSLGNAGDVLNLTEKKDKGGGDLIRKLTVPKNPTKANPALRWTPTTAAEDFARFYAYNVQDGVTELEASLRIPDLSPRERIIWEVDQAINHRGMYIDLKAVADCIAIVDQATQKYGAELSTITAGRVTKHTQVADTLDWLKTRGVYLMNLDEETVEEQLKKPHERDVLRVLRIRELLSFGCVKKLHAMREQTCADGRLRLQYAYAAAHTLLWNGQGVQVANLYKGRLHTPEEVERALAVIGSRCLEYVEAIYGDALETVADCLRSMICASPGHRLISSDYSAIQAVVTSALAGEAWRMEVFRTHGKIYEAMASRVTGVPLETYLAFKKQHGAHHDDRQLGKLATLSADFGAWIAGWKRFGADKFGDDEWIKQTILKVRAAQPMITEMWGGQVRNKFKWDEKPELYGLEGAAISAVLDPGTCYAYRSVRYQMHGDILFCMPPGNGDPLIYHEPRLTPAKRDWCRPWELDLSYIGWNSNQTKGAGGWVRMSLYGGVLTQNVVAKVSREYQADSLVRCERSGLYRPVMHTHDEIVTEVADGQGNVAEYLALVNQPREGGYDELGPWPVKAPAAEETHRYGKWE